MDLQGTPLPHGPRSTKVTTDPKAYQQPIEEPSGPVANDSLAAESVRGGGGFSENRGAQPASHNQSSLKNSSGSTELPSVPVGGLRDDRERAEKYPEGLGGQGNFPGAHHSGYAGGPTAAKQEMGIGGQTTASGSSQYNAGQAPSYVADVTDGYQGTKPDGRNIHEGGFNSNDAKNASLNSEPGSINDPGRAAVNKFQQSTSKSALNSGVPTQTHVGDQGSFDALERDQRA
ncbi:uncharacterized protein N7469_008381 [Penicillium citrinum]|uniref:Uncharacterized protein n=2 Tax=Penicillium TaxID=5073 RepID=A0A9W9NS31_PENCI|nr:uncharacterized protein N7469_008381 [Penicillium citrinum]KAJ5224878.1 hypothetical protein N7469_008381 [Penicillium citrinum]KAJ5575135.1 hypothetical protein N7450_009034 [Penicillium hetheringtonii]KAK5796401.1 hypothetical protein VI817_005686 [Penicillium citrinum]